MPYLSYSITFHFGLHLQVLLYSFTVNEPFYSCWGYLNIFNISLITWQWLFLFLHFLGLCTMRENCPYSELFWSVFCRIWTEYEEILRISSYSVRIRENADQNNSEYGHFYVMITSDLLILFDDSAYLVMLFDTLLICSIFQFLKQN